MFPLKRSPAEVITVEELVDEKEIPLTLIKEYEFDEELNLLKP
jgi:hypothetical protein